MTPEQVALEFCRCIREDRARGGVGSLEAYQSRWAGHEALIAVVYAQVEVQEEDGASDERLGPYDIGEELGRGGQAVVYRARDTRLNREVALKILKHLGPGSEDTLRRFRRPDSSQSSTRISRSFRNG